MLVKRRLVKVGGGGGGGGGELPPLMPLYASVFACLDINQSINQSINLTQSIFIHTRASFFLTKFHVNQFHFSEGCMSTE